MRNMYNMCTYFKHVEISANVLANVMWDSPIKNVENH